MAAGLRPQLAVGRGSGRPGELWLGWAGVTGQLSGCRVYGPPCCTSGQSGQNNFVPDCADPWARLRWQPRSVLHLCSGQPWHDSPSGPVPVAGHNLVLRVGPWAAGHMANYSHRQLHWKATHKRRIFHLVCMHGIHLVLPYFAEDQSSIFIYEYIT